MRRGENGKDVARRMRSEAQEHTSTRAFAANDFSSRRQREGSSKMGQETVNIYAYFERENRDGRHGRTREEGSLGSERVESKVGGRLQ